MTFADSKLDPKRSDFNPLNDLDGRIQADYDADFYHGAPVALQLMGRRLEDEKVLEMVDTVADLLKKQDTR